MILKVQVMFFPRLLDVNTQSLSEEIVLKKHLISIYRLMALNVMGKQERSKHINTIQRKSVSVLRYNR